MALAVPRPRVLTTMPSSGPASTSDSGYRIIISPSEPPCSNRDARIYEGNTSTMSLSQAESDEDEDTPISPITFGANEAYERSRLSFVPPFPRPSSTPSTPLSANHPSPVSPVIFTQLNSSSPSLAYAPPPVFPSAGTLSLAMRLKRPLPPLPPDAGMDDDTDDADTRPLMRSIAVSRSTSMKKFLPRNAGSSRWHTSPSSSDERDSDSSPGFSPAASSQSPSTSVYTTASSDSAGSIHVLDGFRTAPTLYDAAAYDPKPRFPPLTIPARSASVPVQMPAAVAAAAIIGQPIVVRHPSPSIAVTPASPGAAQNFPSFGYKQRSASSTSIVLASPYSPPPLVLDEHAYTSEPMTFAPLHSPTSPPPPLSLHDQTQAQVDRDLVPLRTDSLPPRAASPAPSLSPSVASGRSLAKASTQTLRRIASRTRLFGRRTLSSASEPAWTGDAGGAESVADEHNSHSLDESRLGTGSSSSSRRPSFESIAEAAQAAPAPAPAAGTGRGPMRLEIAEATLTSQGDVWETRELHDVIPKLRLLRVASRNR
ncbi:uncharacterized protein BXZ73DRAFT_98474 [Epithele typhae]|uniref:uncharacterized protein n=1 Tax=Epithele typhae TaxID=378194 RepID=UPI00200776A7|nr:uncharacterized protein BXZ73DRAFT_98474 [Epithele typhae]KAH9941258.1 hypothetical protein BXZ73DRAFT_98474 [Epithele typhae]